MIIMIDVSLRIYSQIRGEITEVLLYYRQSKLSQYYISVLPYYVYIPPQEQLKINIIILHMLKW